MGWLVFHFVHVLDVWHVKYGFGFLDLRTLEVFLRNKVVIERVRVVGLVIGLCVSKN